MKFYKGKIISMKMAKTITVEVERLLAHPIYKKGLKEVKNITFIVKKNINWVK